MSNFWKRTVFGTLFVVVVIGSLWLHFGAFFAVMAFVVFKGSEEMCAMFSHIDDTASDKPARLLSLLLFFFLAYFSYFGFASKWLSLLLLFPLLPFVVALFLKKSHFASIAVPCWTSMFFVALPCGLMTLFLGKYFAFAGHGQYLLTLSFILIWTNDVFAYLTGSVIGKHKLCERISPKKTIEGSLGGAVFAMLAAFLVNRYVNPLMSDWCAVGLGLVSVVFGSLGDLCESMLKRQAGIKDSGDLIPGHGGILDRFDASFLAIPSVFVYLTLVA